MLPFPSHLDMQVKLIGNSKFPVGVTVSMNGCPCLCVSQVIDWCVPASRLMSAGIDSSPHLNPLKGTANGWMNVSA